MLYFIHKEIDLYSLYPKIKFVLGNQGVFGSFNHPSKL
jgi:hypothetical protein